jgi:hypothetical protein
VPPARSAEDLGNVEKVRDIVGLYLNPPDKAVVLCVDEKTQIQALDRTQPLLPMELGYVEGVTHDVTPVTGPWEIAYWRGTAITVSRNTNLSTRLLAALIKKSLPLAKSM